MYPPPVAEGGWSEFIKDFGIGSGGALKLGPASQLTKSKAAGYRWLVSAGILVLVEQGLRKGDIAERLGCEESTLVVRCSIAGISLRGPNRLELRAGVPLTLSPRNYRELNRARCRRWL